MPRAAAQAGREGGPASLLADDSAGGPVPLPACGGRPAASCPHLPPCPPPQAPGRLADRTVACQPEQGWSLLCNGVAAFDTGVLLPGGSAIGPPDSIRLPGDPDRAQAGHVRTVAPVPPGRVRTTGLRRPVPVMAGAALARERAYS
jgi:hypothetical protein